jgi:hypothetical protein
MILLLLPILFEAISEGLYLRGEMAYVGHFPWKTISKQVQVLLIASWFFIIWKLDFSWDLVAVYILLRFAVFNYVHNLSAGLKLGYLGRTSFIDRVITIVSFGSLWLILAFQVVCLGFVWAILTNRI